MSFETATTNKRGRLVVGSLVASAAILVVSWWSLGGGTPAASEPAAAPAAAAFTGGVKPEAVDRATRWDPDPSVGDEPRAAATPALPRLAAAPAEPVEPPRGRGGDAVTYSVDYPSQEILDARAAASAALADRLKGQRRELAKACLGDGASSATVVVQVRYDADGSPMGHTVAGDDMVVAECVGKQALALALPGTGAMVKAKAELSLP